MPSFVRLNAALNYIDESDVLADVGCDHGYLGIEAIKKGVKKVLFIDNKQGPLNKAIENAKYYIDIADCKFLLSSGIKDITTDVTKVAILGMGGNLIADIIDADIDKVNNQMFILEANSKVDILRKYLFDNNFLIVDEVIVKEKDKFYELIYCKKTKDFVSYNKEDIIFGPVLRNKKDVCFIEKWTNICSQYKEIVKNSDKKLDDLEEMIKLIEENL